MCVCVCVSEGCGVWVCRERCTDKYQHVCGEWSVCTCIYVCSVPLLTAFWGGKFQ